MSREINRENGIVRIGNRYRLKRLMERAAKGEALTIGFIGGSITQGCLASDPGKCYAMRVFDWWRETFPQADLTYINAGIGATDSQFGAARAEEDLLYARPDLVIVEFSVNDESNSHFLETYEGLVRNVLTCPSEPAVLLVHNVCYDTGASAQLQHGKIGRHYDLPCLSMQSSIYPELLAGRIENREITPDDLHPNDEGHTLVASVITYYLEKIRTSLKEINDSEGMLPPPLTGNAYEKSRRYDNRNSQPICTGFRKDERPQKDLADCFKNGWFAENPGDRITFLVQGTGISLQYRKSVKKPAPLARVVIDGNSEKACLLDAAFSEDWGDKPELETICEELPAGEHQVEITLIESGEKPAVPFYLMSVIANTCGN